VSTRAGDPEGRPALAAALELEPHPEGGWYRRTWTSPASVATPGGERPAATMILYYLDPGEASAWHVVASDEAWLWHGPGTVRLQSGGSGARPEPGELVVLGPDAAAGERPQLVFPGGTWQRALSQQRDGALVSCVVSPGFSFDDWRLA